MNRTDNPGIFDFDKSIIERHIFYEMEIPSKFKSAFNYLVDKLGTNEVVSDLGTLAWSEGKSYKWVALKSDNVQLLIRQYGTHFTIYFKCKKKTKIYHDDIFDELYNTKYGCFTFNTNDDFVKDEESDMYVDDNFLDLNKHIKTLIKIIKDDKVHGLWNDHMFKREKQVEVKNVWNGGENFSSIDLLIFACEELFQKYLEIFSMTDTFEKVKTFKVGDKAGPYTITKVHTELKDGYYHSVGLNLKDMNGPKSDSFHDVFSLTRYYYKELFVDQEEEEDDKGNRNT